jgi:hypothetical protein
MPAHAGIQYSLTSMIRRCGYWIARVKPDYDNGGYRAAP